MNLERILLQHFPAVRTAADARAIGVDAWLDTGATMAVIKALFPVMGPRLSPYETCRDGKKATASHRGR